MLCLYKLGNFHFEFRPDFEAALIAGSMGFVRCGLMIAVIKQAIGNALFERQPVTVGNLWNFKFDLVHIFHPYFFIRPMLGTTS
ncbi:hypothetical protein BV908_13310 [Diaphorobacter sp. LR2014-1]|nr:hypothetical protein BV908_13310 [Diaphorobacter sp. LR2014-1]